eukprot:CAMPEP_0197448912 /NCGR_PEP_ID=MMETSP1175-20131217/19509_1 /TAXON_ID=1003142 /ORGANISM="Triceratium dubium, Strain CCMP147" /LENGTH=632 /DNA_ID=CAMNT_0042980843 /DNA_START=36 /DNA_END=1934 /DNA_ORIENTATION=+
MTTLNRREQRRRAKAMYAARQENEGSCSHFTCSQTIVDENDKHWKNALDINIPSFTIGTTGKVLYQDSSLRIARGRRYGLVGPNGQGKSTLLKTIASGNLKIPPRIDRLYVEQEIAADATPAVDAVLKADKERWDLIQEEKALTEALEDGENDPEKLDRLKKIYEELEEMGASGSDAKARTILHGLGFTSEMQTRATEHFSGGWRMRISLARALFVEPTLLMLDEPTNHLDLNAVIWLTDYLQRWKKTLLVVSHDQDFLNDVCEEIIHLDKLQLIPYKGNYDTFKKLKDLEFRQQCDRWAKLPKTKANKALRPRDYQVRLNFPIVPVLSRPVLEVNKVHFRYSPKHPVLFDRADMCIDMDSRICIVGNNGAGKSTLLNLLTGELKPTRGEVRKNPRLRIGIYSQHFADRLPMEKTPVEHLLDRCEGEDRAYVRGQLGKFGLPGEAHLVPMSELSGGQKARVMLVDISLQRPHILLLDEPTNNLDIETIDALVDAMNEFNGGIVVVTHDQRLIQRCGCELWVVDSAKQDVTRWSAGYKDYRKMLLREIEETAERESAVRGEKAAENRAQQIARIAIAAKKPKDSTRCASVCKENEDMETAQAPVEQDETVLRFFTEKKRKKKTFRHKAALMMQ